MDFEDILKVVGVIAFFVISSMFDSKKKKKNGSVKPSQPEPRIRPEHSATDAQTRTAPTVRPQQASDFFDEVRRMLEEAEKQKTAQATEEEYKPQYPVQTAAEAQAEIIDTYNPYSTVPLSAVDDNYFEKEYDYNKKQYQLDAMPTPEQEGHPSTFSADMKRAEHAKNRVKPTFNLRQAIKHQIILERKVDW